MTCSHAYPPAARLGLRAELRPLVRLAWPVVAAEIGWITMWLVDTMMVGRVGPEARLGIEPHVLRGAVAYLEATIWSLVPLLLFTALRQYLQGVGIVRPAMVALVSANLVNVAADWLLIFGRLGAPRLGAAGAGWATCLSRVYMLLVLVAYVVWHERRHPTGLCHVALAPAAGELRTLLRLGLPAAAQRTLELGVVAATTMLAARLAPVALAAHQLALVAASLTFMVPLGVSAAGAVRVGHAVGAGDGTGAARAGWAALALGGGFMVLAGGVFWTLPREVARIFTSDPAVVTTAAALLLVAAVFQLFDGLQVVATGVLRGCGDTRRPMIANLVGHWLLGLPVGAALCFGAGWGVVGLWIGLSVGLIAVALTLVRAWAWRVAELGVGRERDSRVTAFPTVAA
jgi:MATE family, multidrug efflux pump